MPSAEIPITVKLGCAECYSFLLQEAARYEREIARVRKQHDDFVEELTAALQEHGVPAATSWRDAIDWLARYRP